MTRACVRACVRKPRGDVVSSDNEPVIDLSEPVGGSQGKAVCHAGTRNIPFDPSSSPIDARRPCCTLAPRWLLVPASLFVPLLASRQRPANGTLPSNREIPTVAGRIGRECVSRRSVAGSDYVDGHTASTDQARSIDAIIPASQESVRQRGHD